MKGVDKMNRLKELRQEKNLSQKELAEDIGVHYRTLQNWENGESQIKPDKAQTLAEYFGVSVGYVLGYDGLKNQILETEALLLDGLERTKKISLKNSSAYDFFLKGILELLQSLKTTTKASELDSDTLLEVIETLEGLTTDLDSSVKTMMEAQERHIELREIKKKLDESKNKIVND